MTPLLIKSCPAAAEIAGNRLVSFDVDGNVVPAAAATAAIIGISERMGAPLGGMADVVQAGWYAVVAGGDLDPGVPFTADANGAAVLAAPAVGTIVRYGGFVMASAVAGDLVPALILPGIINTP